MRELRPIQPRTIPRTHALERPKPKDLLDHPLLIFHVSHSHHCQLQQLNQHLPCHSVIRRRQHSRCFQALLLSHSPSTLHLITPSQHRLSIPRREATSKRPAHFRLNRCTLWPMRHPRRTVLRTRSSLKTRRQTSDPRCRLRHLHKKVTLLPTPQCSQWCYRRLHTLRRSVLLAAGFDGGRGSLLYCTLGLIIVCWEPGIIVCCVLNICSY